MNLIEGLLAELNRNREILKLYESIPEGVIGTIMIKRSIAAAEHAMSEGDTVGMMRAYDDLKSTK